MLPAKVVGVVEPVIVQVVEPVELEPERVFSEISSKSVKLSVNVTTM